MRSTLAGLRTLVLPWGAGPGTPRLVLGGDIPPELATYYALEPATVLAVFLWQSAGPDYSFDALIVVTADGSIRRVVGGYNGVVTETYRLSVQGNLTYGARGDVVNITWANVAAAIFRNTALLRMGDLSTLEIQATASLLDASMIAVKASEAQVNSSATLVADDQLILPVAAGRRYQLDAVIFYQTTGVANFKIQWDATYINSCRYHYVGDAVGGAPVTADAFANGVIPLGVAGSFTAVRISGIVAPAVGQGTFGLSWAQNTNTPADTTKVLSQSYMHLRRFQ